MKVAPVSGDLLVELALGAALLAAAWWALRRAGSALSDANASITRTAQAAADAVNPLNDNNVFAQGANGLTSAIAGRPETLGGWLYTATHADPAAATSGEVPQASGWTTPPQAAPCMACLF